MLVFLIIVLFRFFSSDFFCLFIFVLSATVSSNNGFYFETKSSGLAYDFASICPGKITSLANALMISAIPSYNLNAFLKTPFCIVKIYFLCALLFASFIIPCVFLFLILSSSNKMKFFRFSILFIT